MSLDVCQKEPGCSNNYVDKYELGGKGEVSGKTHNVVRVTLLRYPRGRFLLYPVIVLVTDVKGNFSTVTAHR